MSVYAGYRRIYVGAALRDPGVDPIEVVLDASSDADLERGDTGAWRTLLLLLDTEAGEQR